ncbi:MAG: hypothetical protein HXX14_05370 [Bacteroidetes bacterium]|nr:hypothetical protein [Bacteroidota bacterium]
MNKKILIPATVLMVLLIAIVSVYFYVNKAKPNYGNLKPEYTLESKQLYDAFKKDSKASATLYNGKMIELNGAITKVEASDTLVTLVFSFTQGMFGDEGVRCTMLPTEIQKAKLTKAGETIKVKGICQGFNDTDVVLEKCSLIQK